MIPAIDFATIALMALVTYGTRAGGYLVLRNRALGVRAQVVMAAAPGCVLIAVIAPHFVSPRRADLITLAITMATAARVPMLATVAIAVSSAGVLRHLLG